MKELEKLASLFEGAPPLRIAVAESLTSGHLQALLSTVPRASSFYEGGITTYTLEQKVRHLRVDRGHAAACDSVSLRVACEMAAGVCRLFGTELGLATTGYATTTPPGVKRPFAFWSLSHRTGGGGECEIVRSGRVEPEGLSEGEPMQQRVAVVVLEELVSYLEALRA